MTIQPGDIVMINEGASYYFTKPGSIWRVVDCHIGFDKSIYVKCIDSIAYNPEPNNREMSEFFIPVSDVKLMNLSELEEVIYGL